MCGDQIIPVQHSQYHGADAMADIAKSIGPRSSISKNSGGLMKTLIVDVRLSGKIFLEGAA